MKKLILSFLIISSSLFSQPKKGFCRITEATPDANKLARVTFKFLGPDGKPVLSRLDFKINDSLISPKIDKKGTYSMVVKPGEYTFTFYMKYWYDVVSKPIVLKPKTNTSLLVKMEAQNLSSGVK